MKTRQRAAMAIAPPRFPCTDCRLSHGGCAIKWIAHRTACCRTCTHHSTSTEQDI